MSEDISIKQKKKFSLIELLMIIMLVGIIITFTVPLQTAKKNKEKLSEAIVNLQKIARIDVNFKNNPNGGDGDYAMIIDQLNLQKNPDIKMKYFDYSVTDTTIVAVTNKNFGKTGAGVFFYLPEGPFGLTDNPESKKVFDANWLP